MNDAFGDADPASFTEPEDALDEPETIGDALDMPLVPAGLGGALRSATLLAAAFDDDEHTPDVRVVDLPHPARSEDFDKVDLDDYLNGWSDGLDAVLASAKPATAFQEYDRATRHMDRGGSTPAGREPTSELGAVDRTAPTGDDRSRSVDPADPHGSSLWAIDMADVTPAGFSNADNRGRNPAAHTGDSETYFVLREGRDGDLVASDYKGTGGKAKYNALTYLLVDGGARDRDRPEGSLSDREVWIAWKHARETGILPLDDEDDEELPDPIPLRALWHVAREHGLADPEDTPDDYDDGGLPSSAYNAGLDVVREEYGIDPGREPIDDRREDDDHPSLEVCEPPEHDATSFDVERRREELKRDRLAAVLEDDHLHVWADDPGVGKTTNAGIGADEVGEPHVLYFDKHRKAREHATDSVTPGGYYHIKGGEQKRKGHCMDADHERDRQRDRGDEATTECPEHGHPANCPSMCPVYDRGSDDPVRVAYEALVPEIGPLRAHMVLGVTDENEHEWHPEQCAWMQQYDEVQHHERVVAVHPYATQKTTRESDHGDRLCIIDEAFDPTTEREVTVEDLVRTESVLEQLADRHGAPDGCRELAAFARRVRAVFTDPDAPDSLAELEPPAIAWDTIRDVTDPISGEYVERKIPAETFAKIKVEYGETVLERMRRDEWTGEPISIDPLLAAAMKAGLDANPVRQAIAVPPVLETCPWCRSDVAYDNGARCCSSDRCDWHEQHNTITRKDSERASATAGIDTNENDRPRRMQYLEAPRPSDLPDPSNTLVLDATADLEKIAALFDVDPDEVCVTGDDALELPNLHATQVLDGMYHESTIARSLDEGGTLAERIQQAIDTAGNVHRRPLFVLKKGLMPRFEFPENARVEYYHALRGLNYDACDAVMMIGASHPNIDDCRRRAEVLVQGRNDLRVGGDEHSTRRDAPNPPVYRKLHYQDENDRGRAVPTKHYTGLVGTLFREGRESELIQTLHRVRPLLADETKNAYLLTNVPTSIPIDNLATFEELADPLEAMLPVPEGAIDLAAAIEGIAIRDTQIDGFQAGGRLLEHESGTGDVRINKREATDLARRVGVTNQYDSPPSYRTVSRWIDALEDVGLLAAGEYEQREGVRFSADPATLTRALSVLSGNGGFKVAAARRFRALVENAGGSLGWLKWAREAFSLSGDRCELDPPPDPAG